MKKAPVKKVSIRSLSVDVEVWEKAKKILKDDLNMAISKYIDLQLRALIRSKSGSYAEFMQGTLEDTMRIMKGEVEGHKKKSK